MSFHEFTKYDRSRHVAAASGDKWTVNIERGNTFQGWRWFNSLDEAMGSDFGGLTVIVGIVADLPFRFAKVVSFYLRGRKDWRVTVRRGLWSERGSRRDAVVDEMLPSKVEAARRANALVREIESGSFGERMKAADQTQSD